MARNVKSKRRSVEVRILQVSEKSGHDKDAAQGEEKKQVQKKPRQSLHSVQIHL